MDKIEQISNDVQALNAKVDGHIGNYGEEVHQLPEYGNAGFMPYDLYVKNKALFEKRPYITNQSVDDLEPGFYYGNHLTDIPADAEEEALALIDVTTYEDVRKSIRYQQGFTEATWIKNIHAPNADVPSHGWRKQFNYNILWSGRINKVNSTITLTDAKSNYNNIGFVYEGMASNAAFAMITSKRSTFTFDAMNIPNNNTDIVIAGSEMVLDFGNSQTVAKIAMNHTINVSTNVGINDKPLVLTNIIGIDL